MTISTETSTLSHLNNLLTAVKFQRERRAKVRSEATELLNALNETELGRKYLELSAQLDQINEELGDLEVRAREMAVLACKETGERKPLPGTEVKTYVTVKVTDERAALKWAAENAPATLSLNTSKFQTAVKHLDLPFIEIGEELRGTLSSNLPDQE